MKQNRPDYLRASCFELFSEVVTDPRLAEHEPASSLFETKRQRAILRPHSITSSARARSACGTVRPSAVAVFRLMTRSNVVGCWTGRSAGLAPLRIFPA